MPTIHFGQKRGTDLDAIEDAGYLGWILTQNSGRAGEFAAWYGDEIRERVRQIHREVGARARRLSDYSLNKSQATASTVIDTELLHGDRNAFRLDGGAGYGKSFVTRDIAIRARQLGWDVKAMASSYVASQVLAQQLDGVASTGTIASMCRLSKVRNQDVETYEVVSDSIERMHDLLASGETGRNLVIVDEGSMVGDDIGRPMLDLAHRVDGKLLVVGDRYQLPPVGQEHASPFYHQIDGSIELDEPMRFSRDSDLYILEQQARFNPRAIHQFEIPGSLEVVRHPDQRALVAQYMRDTDANSGDDARMLFFRRDDVAFANEAIRRHRYGADADHHPIMQGEGVMVLETTDVGRTGDSEVDMGTRLYSGQTVHAVNVRVEEVHGIRCPVADVYGVDRQRGAAAACAAAHAGPGPRPRDDVGRLLRGQEFISSRGLLLRDDGAPVPGADGRFRLL